MRLRPLTVAAAVMMAAATLSACDSASPDPEDVGAAADGTAAALVAGLNARDLADVPFTEVSGAEATDDLVSVVEGMGERAATVQLGDVVENDDSATATITWSWQVMDYEEWTYPTEVLLERATDEWAVRWDHDVVEPSLNASSVLDASTIAGSRGDVVGADGVRLVTARSVIRIGIDKSKVKAKKAGASATALARLVGIAPAPYRARVVSAGDLAFVEAITFRSDAVPQRVAQRYTSIEGGYVVPDEVPLAPTRDFAAPLLGAVGEVTAEMIADDPTLQVGDTAGLSGLQARYDDQLRGTVGVVVRAIGSDGKRREITRLGGDDGLPLRLTLDRGLQSSAESLLEGVGPAGALVAVRPSDGAILAAANGPGNDNQNLATFGQYAPGSTFKSVSALALLRRGLRPDSSVACTATVDVDGRDFENYDDYPAGGLGQIPFRTALANSCNTAFIAERDRLKDDDLAAAAASLGLGVDHDLGFPAYFGSVEPPTTETGRAADLIGQGTVLASPLAMATVIASIQQGDLVVPRLVTQVEVSPPEGVTPVSKREAAQLRSLLRSVVTSGSGRLLADVPGADVIAKTGTAEFAADGGEVRTHAWMIAAQGDLAVAVFVAEGHSGSGTAGPILEGFLRAAS
ncbi:penicillin-binding transpeptidase domain-containing protein [Nocardioides sp.]|uniref:penicillin-binding transpeptidase domain-containing protein n=1 Tax=Nocardioides sp. TaxID=35761 RepID=UPI002B279A9E|nr:penicillin-binding transpeptidase domain-containing protein [Nocardioides sp.]